MEVLSDHVSGGGIVSLIRNVFVMGKGEGLAFLLGTFKPYSIFYLLFWE